MADPAGAARWYHTLELPGGVVTPGEYDLRPALARVPFPADLRGHRCLDVGTRDGFWAFAMERAGADEVVGIDVADTRQHDWPEPRPALDAATRASLAERHRAFDVAREALGSSARRVFVNVYDLDAADVGRFDFAVLGTMLLHLSDPVRALKAVRGVLEPGGRLLLNEAVSVSATLLHPRTPTARLMTLSEPFWWIPNVAAVRRYLVAAGFTVEAMGRPYLLRNGPAVPLPRGRQLLRRGNWRSNLLQRAGVPHVWAVARA